MPAHSPETAIVRLDECIGCTKCIQACPVDAIIGASQQLHIILEKECIGCGLCVEPCPVDCIDMVDIPEPLFDKAKAKLRAKARKTRLQQQAEHAREQHVQAKQQRDDYLAAVLARTKSKKGNQDE